MAAIDFPSSPNDGDTFLTNGIYYVYDNTKGVWKVYETGSNFTLNDAQTLDGELPSYYLNYNNFTNTPTVVISADLTTANVVEVTNLYFTNARADLRVAPAFDQANVATVNASSAFDEANLKASTADLTTANVVEVTNLYFTNTRAVSAFTAGSGINLESNGQILSTVTPFTTGKAIAMAIVFGG